MTVVVESGVLARAMRSAASLIERANTIPILANVRLRAMDDRLEIVTSNMDVEYRQIVPLVSGGDLNTTIDAQKLAALAGVSEGAQISLEQEAGRVIAKAGRSRWVLPAINPADFPELAFRDGGASVRVDGKLLASIVSRLSWSICSDTIRYYMCGIYIDAEDDRMRFTAVTGHTFASIISTIEWPREAPAVVIATKFARLMERLVAEADDVVLSWDESKVRLVVGDVILTGKLIDGAFPDYRRVIPPAGDNPIIVDPEVLRKALKRIEVIGLDKTRSVAVDVQAGMLELRSAGTDVGEASEQVLADCQPLHRAGFNGGYLAGALESIGGDTVEIHQARPGDIALIRRTVSDGALCGVMPMRV
jgi:DNA polymerase-3 subunit beta